MIEYWQESITCYILLLEWKQEMIDKNYRSIIFLISFIVISQEGEYFPFLGVQTLLINVCISLCILFNIFF